jgi:hypothetical protein
MPEAHLDKTLSNSSRRNLTKTLDLSTNAASSPVEHLDIGTWVRQHFRGKTRKAVLIKMEIPESPADRLDVLRSLNRMNINHLSLFPDLGGSAEYYNLRLAIPGY